MSRARLGLSIGATAMLLLMLAGLAAWRLGFFEPRAVSKAPLTRLAPPIVDSIDVRAVPVAGRS